MIRLAETRGKLIAVCRGTEPNANGPDNPICEPPRSCTDARTIVPTASPTTVDSLLRWNGMSEDERDKYTNRALPVLEAFLDY